MKTEHQGALARLTKVFPDTPIGICGLKAGISELGIGAEDVESARCTRIVRSNVGADGPEVGTEDIGGTYGTKGIRSIRDIGIARSARSVSNTPGTPDSPDATKGQIGPILTIRTGGMRILPRILPHFFPTKLYEKHQHHLD